MTDKVKDMLEKKLLQYVNTSGNTHMFQAKNGWVVEITIQEEFTDITQVRNKIKLHCNCTSFTYFIFYCNIRHNPPKMVLFRFLTF